MSSRHSATLVRQQILDDLARLPEDGLREVLSFVGYLLSKEQGTGEMEANKNRPDPGEQRPRRPLKDLLGAMRLEGPPPTDAECKRILDEERMKRYG